MQQTTIERALSRVKRYISYDDKELLDSFTKISGQIINSASHNIEAMCPSGTFKIEDYSISEAVYASDYEILTGSYEFQVNDQHYCLNEYEKEKLYQDCIDRLACIDCGKYDDLGDELLERKIDLIEQLIEAIESADFIYDEIMWDTTWNFNSRSINEELARKVGLAVIERQSDGKTFLALRGCGQDLSPQLMAYQALEFGYIDEEYVSKLRDLFYVKHVMGTSLFRAFLSALGLSKFK